MTKLFMLGFVVICATFAWTFFYLAWEVYNPDTLIKQIWKLGVGVAGNVFTLIFWKIDAHVKPQRHARQSPRRGREVVT